MLIREVQKPFSLVIQGKQFCKASIFLNTGNMSKFTPMKETKLWFSKNFYQLKQATGTRFLMKLANFDLVLFRRHPEFLGRIFVGLIWAILNEILKISFSVRK